MPLKSILYILKLRFALSFYSNFHSDRVVNRGYNNMVTGTVVSEAGKITNDLTMHLLPKKILL